MVYLTFGDIYSGVYQSQVIEVCEYLSELSNKKVRLIAFVPYPFLLQQKAILKKKYSRVLVFPMLPAHLHWWKLYLPFLAVILLFVSSKKIFCRGTLTSNIGLLLRKIYLVRNVVFDGRGAQKEEGKEYNVTGDQKINNQIERLEKRAVNYSDYRISVSRQLVQYWENEYDYQKGKEVIIPCTLAESFTKKTSNSVEVRKKYGFGENDIVLVYSGSAAGWQSFALLNDWLDSILAENDNVKVIFLAKKEAVENLSFYENNKSKVAIDWLKPEEVFDVLSVCDYGMLYREKSVTNQVASPTKFAEYLAAGLSVLISEGVGDFTEMVVNEELGSVLSEGSRITLEKLTSQRKKELRNFALGNLTKESFETQYRALLQ